MRECQIDGSRCDSFEIIDIFFKFFVQFLSIFFNLCTNFVGVSSAQFVEADLISWEFGRKFCEFFFVLVCLVFLIWRDKGWICVSLMISLSRRSS